MKNVELYDIIHHIVRWDYLNNNMLISTAMLSAYWENEKKDTLDLLTPFLKYSIAKTTQVGNIVDTSATITHFKSEFGYDTIPSHVVTLILKRLCPKILSKERNNFRLVTSLDEDVQKFEKRHTHFEEQRSKVVVSLTDYLNEHIGTPTNQYNEHRTMNALIDFFVINGICVIQNTIQLEMLKKRDDKQMYCIAQYILEEYNKQSFLFSYIEDMVKGFFVSTTISLQPQNMSVIQSKFKNLKCYVDTRIIINALGMHLPEEKATSLELLNMLKEKGAELYCFEHTLQEINDIILAYKHSLQNPYQVYSHQTLEGWDEQQYTVTDVERYLSLLRTKITSLGFIICEKPAIIDMKTYPFKDTDLINHISANINYKNKEAIETDVQSVASILLLRNGMKSTKIEKCGYIFVTSNILLTKTVNQFLYKHTNTPIEKTPPIISDIDLSSILWLKCYSTHKDFPKHKLLENAWTALEPTPTMLNTFFSFVERIRLEGGITDDEAAIIRVDSFCRKSLGAIAQGDAEAINDKTVFTIRDRLKARYTDKASEMTTLTYQEYLKEKKQNRASMTNALKEIRDMGDKAYDRTYRTLKSIVRGIIALIWVISIVSTIRYCFNSSNNAITPIISAAFGIISIIDMTVTKLHLINKLIVRLSWKRANNVKDKKKTEYERILGSIIDDENM